MKTNKNTEPSKTDKLVYLVIGLSFITVMLGGLALLPSSSGFLKSIVGETQFPIVIFEELQVDQKHDHYVICPDQLCPEGSSNASSPKYKASISELRSHLLSFVDNRPNITLKNINMDIQQFDFTQQVPSSGFPDIITVRIFPNIDGTISLAMYSRSVIGDGVEGANKRRIENWLLIFERYR